MGIINKADNYCSEAGEEHEAAGQSIHAIDEVHSIHDTDKPEQVDKNQGNFIQAQAMAEKDYFIDTAQELHREKQSYGNLYR